MPVKQGVLPKSKYLNKHEREVLNELMKCSQEFDCESCSSLTSCLTLWDEFIDDLDKCFFSKKSPERITEEALRKFRWLRLKELKANLS